jgi:3-oxoacyl-[acyl-carrier protein] reductase
MILDFTGRTVLITGATRGIGAALAAAFEEAGASLLLTATSQEKVDQLNRRNKHDKREHVRWLSADFSSDESTKAFLDVVSRISPIHVLINNAGTNHISTIDKITAEKLDTLMSVNLRAPLLLCSTVSGIMKQQNYGRIVNIASIWSTISKPGRVMYSASKAGLAGMSRAAAVDLAPYGILVNTLSPGFTDTELTKATLTREECQILERSIPLGRFASPDEIAGTVLFLASDRNTYLTGQNIVLDGGFTCV